MSKNPDFEKEMVEWEKEKWNELLKEVKPQVEMIKAQVKLIAVELQKIRDNYDLEFGCDMQDYLDNLIIENL